tara:strand:- start:159 stop:452 length:294 start_codon:yes stop_codon:yes gene_type:complete
MAKLIKLGLTAVNKGRVVSPKLLALPNFYKCPTCQGTCIVYKEKKSVTTLIEKVIYDTKQRRIYLDDVKAKQIIGGIDICPECQANSELTYKEIKNE